MTKRMLIDATHPEETRVVVLNGKRLDEFDFETSTKKQVKGNIYLAKVTRVEPSLQAAFVEFGGNRHGFLAFSEIHPDYYQIPVADRVALLREQEEDLAAENDEDEEEAEQAADDAATGGETAEAGSDAGTEAADTSDGNRDEDSDGDAVAGDSRDEDTEFAAEAVAEAAAEDAADEIAPVDGEVIEAPAPAPVEELGGEDDTDRHAERRRVRQKRQRYKIQEVIKRRQILLVQVVKEERGNKGAALTTYLSLAGRYCVLMPNTAKGGGISRKITNAGDRKKLKSLLSDLEIPDGMAIILRTAAVERSKAELKRDFEFLMRAWDTVRELTLGSIAPTLVYEEAHLIKRSIRDLYTKDVDEVLVEGDEGYKTAKDFMRMLMPSHAKKVQPYRDPEIPLFHRYQVETQLDAMHSAEVQLKSGGYIVINPTEALVSIDVNSGRATRERNIEETAYKTNLEAAEEIARQLKLRDLAGLIVIDFIDMSDHRNQHTVERRMKEAMRSDRARIQIGRISAFGLLELSRQRLRPSLIEASTQPCPHCKGTGLIRSTESAALHVLRVVEDEGIRRRSVELRVRVAVDVALYILNQKRERLREIESRYGFRVLITGDDSLIPPAHEIERIEGRPNVEPRAALPAPDLSPADADEDEDAEAEVSEAPAEEEDTANNRRRRRGRRGRRGQRGAETDKQGDKERDTEDKDTSEEPAGAVEPEEAAEAGEAGEGEGEDGEAKGKRRRRGRRGGRRRGRKRDGEDADTAEAPSDGADAEPMAARQDAAADREQPQPVEPADEDTAPAASADESPAEERAAQAPEPEEAEAERTGDMAVMERETRTGQAGNGTDTSAAEPFDGGQSLQRENVREEGTTSEESAAKPPETPRRKGWWNRFSG